MSSVVLHLGKNDAGMPLSYAEFAEAQFDEPWRYERVHGRLVVMSPAGHEHALTGHPFVRKLIVYETQRNDIVDFVLTEAWVCVDDDTDRIVDIGVYLCGVGEGKIPHRVPAIIVEVVSPSLADRRRDYEEKRAEFERIGVKEYVIVDRFRHQVTVLRLADGGYQETVLSPSDIYTTPLMPGLEIPLVEVL